MVGNNINLVILDDEPRISEGIRELFLAVCPAGTITASSFTGVSKNYMNEDPDILIADANLSLDNEKQGLLQCEQLQRDSGRMARSIVLTKQPVLPFHENACAAMSVIKKSRYGDKTDKQIAELIEEALKSDDVKRDLKIILSGSCDPLPHEADDRYKKFECIYPITFALRNAMSEISLLHNTRYFWLGQPLRRGLQNLRHSPFWSRKDDEWHFWEDFDPHIRNHDEILHGSIKRIITFYEKFLFSAKGSGKQDGIQKLVEYFRACEPMLFAQSVKKGEPINYRDHFFHPFHNFLLGVLLIDWMIEVDVLKGEVFDKLFKSTLTEDADIDKGAPIWLQWFFAAIFHDMGYFLSKSEDWVADFFSMFLGRKYKKDSHLSAVFGQADYQADISHLADLVESGNVSKKYNCCTGNKNRSCTRSYFENQLNSALRYDLDHGVLSALVFLTTYYAPRVPGQDDPPITKREEAEHRDRILRIKRAAAVSSANAYGLTDDEKRMADMHRDIVLPACLAIAVHHNVFQHYSPVHLEIDPLTFLLKFVDVCQEYSRPTALLFGSDTCDGVNGGGVDLLGLQFIRGKDKIPECRVILGCRSKQRFDSITSEASILFGRNLISNVADFSMIVVNTSHKEGIAFLNEYFEKKNGSLVPKKDYRENEDIALNLMWFSTWQPVPSENGNA